MTADVGNAFCTAPCAEKVYSRAGPEFGDKQGSVVVLQRALHGLKSACRFFHEFFADCLLRMGSEPTRVDPDLWYKKSDDYDGYDYIALTTWLGLNKNSRYAICSIRLNATSGTRVVTYKVAACTFLRGSTSKISFENML